MGKIESVSGRLGRTLFLLAFAVSFSWFGVTAGVVPLVGLVGQWYLGRSYVAVPASVQSTSLKFTAGETRTERVQASFAYRYRDRDYVSDRVSSSALSDNFDPYHRTIHARLLEAKEAGQQVTIWVDPEQPASALYDRSFRGTPALFLLPFAVLFPAVGLGAWWGLCLVWWGKRDAGREFRPGQSQGPSLGDRHGPLALALFALFFNMLSWPIAMLLVLQAPPNRSLAFYLVLIFPLIGLGLAYWAAVMWRASWRIGKPMLELSQVPGGRQYTLCGRIHFSPALGMRLNPALQMHPVRITVKLQQTISSGEDTTVSTLWEQDMLDTTLMRGAAGVNFSGELPSAVSLPSTPQLARRDWVLELRALGTEISFDLPEAVSAGLD